jgi:REP element-mobilizing transposase RayT
MSRQPRNEYEAGVHHVYARGNGRQAIYVDDHDRQTYLAMLARVSRKLRWRCLSYCLMTNHIHLLVETRAPNLGAGIHRLHGPYAQRFNRRHGRTGHLFEHRFGAVRASTDAQVWMTAAYIARNPVDARLCRSAADWPWSSHRAVVAGCPPDWLDATRLFSYFDPAGGDPRVRYAELVEGLAQRAIQP